MLDLLRSFFLKHHNDYKNVISTDDLTTLPDIRLKMIIKMYEKSDSLQSFKKNLMVLKVYGVGQNKFDMFVENLYKVLNGNNEQIHKSDEPNNRTKQQYHIHERLSELDHFLKLNEVDDTQVVLFPKNERQTHDEDVDQSGSNSSQLNKINGIEVCLDSSMDLLKVSLQNKQMLNFYKSKLNINVKDETISEEEIEDNTEKDHKRELPIMAYELQIQQIVNENQICIITSQTGSGKSTQVPQFLLSRSSKIVMSQPRRLATTSLAKRISTERKCNLGEEVGYKIRFENKTSTNTKLTVMTEGILVNELTTLIKNNQIVEYTHILIDEAHERSMNMDIIFGLVKLGIRKRLLKNTKIVIMSATLDSSEYKRFFYNLPVLEVHKGPNEGRVFMVTEIFTKRPCYDQYKEAFRLIKQIHEQQNIDKSVLIFMPGLEDIEVMAALINSVPMLANETDVIKLHSSKAHNNDRLFKNVKNKRKIILATNIAETSITLPSLSFMIDSGLYKLKTEYKNLHKLTTVPITKMMMKQRVGRLGRVCEGTIYHLFTEDDYEMMLDKNISEIEITNLKHVMLIKHYIDNNLKFIKDPIKYHCQQAERALLNHGCLVKQEDTLKVSKMGEFIINTPLAYSHARLLYLTKINGCLDLGIDLVSMLSQKNIFLKDNGNVDDKTMMSKGKRYENLLVSGSDHLSLVNIFKQYSLQNDKESWCSENDLNYQCLLQIEKIHNQLSKTFNIKRQISNHSMDGLVKAVSINLCAENIAKRINHKEYQILNNGLKCTIHPQSCLYGNIGDLPEYVSFEEILILNDKNYLITISTFDPSIVIQQEICRYDYKVIKKIGCKNIDKVDEICKKLNEWKDLDTQLKNTKKDDVFIVANTKHKVEMEDDNFMFKKNKKTKRILNLLD
ncbi:uncharacterized protein HGUI_03859 [Hanseniaspora guilliermondii]|uniref:Uncharacterized protein n=1 Tax=Hanseniaspora guilliermondii TaxID=56406 RepID=A0A1L0B5I9_9ASCO|nr:uncharacterized protein HGUI_03859 [Hanseniaspora guilliermondii]